MARTSTALDLVVYGWVFVFAGGEMNHIGFCDYCKGRVLPNRGAVCCYCGHAVHYGCSGEIS